MIRSRQCQCYCYRLVNALCTALFIPALPPQSLQIRFCCWLSFSHHLCVHCRIMVPLQNDSDDEFAEVLGKLDEHEFAEPSGTQKGSSIHFAPSQFLWWSPLSAYISVLCLRVLPYMPACPFIVVIGKLKLSFNCHLSAHFTCQQQRCSFRNRGFIFV